MSAKIITFGSDARTSMKAGVDARDWNKAADEMVDSRWYTQVPNRARRLVERMRSLSEVEV